MPGIAVVGSLNLDTTVRVPRLPRPGETVLGTGHFSDTGGKGANQAVAAARLGRSVAMFGMVGDDDAGRRLTAALLGDGVDIAQVARSQLTGSGMAVITVDESGENMIVVDPGANGAFSVDVLAGLAPALASADLVLLQLEIPLSTVAAAVDTATGIVVLNPAPAASLDPAVLVAVDVLVPNATELALLTGGEVPDTPTAAIDLARDLKGPTNVVVTLGAAGAVVVGDELAVHVPAPDVEAVDPTAAGDAFCAGVADALVRGETIEDAVRWAVRVGAVTTTRWGAQASLPTPEEVLALGGTE